MKKYVAPEAIFIEFDGQLVTISPSCPIDFDVCDNYSTCDDYVCPGPYGTSCSGPEGHVYCTNVT